MQLNNKQRHFLKGLSHSLKPTVLLGQHGLTEGVMLEIDHALAHHELIKVKAATADRTQKALIMDAIIRESQAVEVQRIGHIITLYRPAKEPIIRLPR